MFYFFLNSELHYMDHPVHYLHYVTTTVGKRKYNPNS